MKMHHVKKNQIGAKLILRIFCQTPLHVLGEAHHQEVHPYLYNNWHLLFFLDDCCWAYLGPSSGGTPIFIQQLALIILFRRLLLGVSRPIIRRYNHMYTTIGT
jgi:hypothetical protein